MRRNEDEMDNQKLADLLFPEVVNTPNIMKRNSHIESFLIRQKLHVWHQVQQDLFILGNLYSALADERIAHRNGGVFYLRIEDTDEKRKVDGAVETIINVLRYFDIEFDEVLALMIQTQEMLMDHISRDRELKFIIHMLRAL